MENLKCGKYVEFNFGLGKFSLTLEASEIIYRKKNAIQSYSGADEWCNHIFCQLLDLYLGVSPFNYALGCYEHEQQIPVLYRENKESVISWINKSKDDDTFKTVCKVFDFIFENIPDMN